MGDILDKVSQNIQYDDVSHNWTEQGAYGPSVEEFFNSPQILDQDSAFMEDGYKLIKQTFPYKGIRYGGSSIFDRKTSLFNVLNMSLENAVGDKVQENLNKLVAETFFGNPSDETSGGGNEPCGSGGAEGVFDGELWMGEIKAEWIKKTSAKAVLDYGAYSDDIINTLNTYAPKQKMAPARALAQVMIEGGHYKHTRDTANAWGCKGIGQFAKGSWKAPYDSAVKKYPELKKYDGSWSANSSSGGPGHPVLGVVVMMEYMLRIHEREMEKALPGKDEDFWWSAIGYLMGPRRAANILKESNGDRVKCDDIARRMGIGAYAKKGVAFYGNTMLKKWKEYSKAVPKSQKDSTTEADEPETQVNSCSTDTGDVTSKVKWTPGQEIGDFSGKESDRMGYSAYGVPKGGTGRSWMKGDGKQGLHLEFEKAMDAVIAEAAKKGLKISYGGGFRSYEAQVETKKNRGNAAASPGNSIHGIGYALDITGTVDAKKFLRNVGPKYGIFAPLWDGNGAGVKENWHFQLHPDLAYTLKQRWEARGKKWD